MISVNLNKNGSDWHQLSVYSTLQEEISQDKSKQICPFSIDSALIKKNEIKASASDSTLYYPFIWILVLIQFWMLE